jgi:hypothetical protein
MTMSGMPNEYTSGYRGEVAPTVGARVVTADGDELGRVTDLAAGCFKVDVTMQPDYWLGNDTIASAGITELRLSITKDRVGEFKLDGPEHSGVHHHTV